MNNIPILFNLLPYRPAITGLSRYVQRLLASWPEESLPYQLRLTSAGSCELTRSPLLPADQRSPVMRCLQGLSLVQHAVPSSRLLSPYNPGLIYSPYTDFLWSLPGVPQVITCHDLTPLYFPNSRRAYLRSRFWLPLHMQHARVVLAISRTVADQLVEHGLPADRIVVVLNGVELTAEPISSPAGGDCLLLARHARNKNIELALTGFARLLALEPAWPGQLVVLGLRDRCTPALIRQQRELGLEGRVRWVERLSNLELQALLRSALCLISTSLMEGFDYPLLEAQALGLPTLASRIPVHEELHQNAALMFELDDRGVSMADNLRRLGREPALWRQLSQAGLRNASAHTSQRQASELHRLLHGLLT